MSAMHQSALAARCKLNPAAAFSGRLAASTCRPAAAHDRGWQAAGPPAAVQQHCSRRQHGRRRGPLAPAACGDADSPSLDEEEEEAREKGYIRGLLLTFFAMQNRSLFAAKCFVEMVMEMYRQGVRVDDVKVALKLEGLQHGGKLLEPLDEDILLNWVAVVMSALEMVGVPLLPQGFERQERRASGGGGAAEDPMVTGLKGLVRIAVDQYLSGINLYRLQLQQSMAGQVGDPEARGESPAVRMLQQNTRLVIIALEVVRDLGLPTLIDLEQPRFTSPVVEEPAAEGGAEQAAAAEAAASAAAGQAEQAAAEAGPAAEAAAAAGSEGQAGAAAEGEGEPEAPALPSLAAPGFVLACNPELLARCSREEQQRAAGVRLLISFMGAAMGSLYAAWDFVAQCVECYSSGWAADEAYGRLHDEEFAQSGGLARLRVARLPGNSNVTATVLARWVSIVYMALAQLRVVFPGAMEQGGWAWVSGASGRQEGGESTTLEAYGLADFVLHTIRNEEQREQERTGGSGGSGGGKGEGQGQGPAAEEAGEMRVVGVLVPPGLSQQPQEGFVTLEDPRLRDTSPTTLVFSQQISLVQMTRQLVLQERAKAAAPA